MREHHSPQTARNRLSQLEGYRRSLQKIKRDVDAELKRLTAFLALCPACSQALEQLSQSLFQELLDAIQEKMTIALQEVLDQPIRFVATAEYRRNVANVDFAIERDGCQEDIMKGQGGSVANILSVGLRMFALMTLDEGVHRRFLVLDEQDCWLRPDLVPHFVKIVRDAGRELGFQTLMISHHDDTVFDAYADKIYHFTPDPAGVRCVERQPRAAEEDQEG